MSTNALNYEAPRGARPPQRIWARRRLAWFPWRRVGCGIAALLLVFAVFTLPVRTVEVNVDRVTGSVHTRNLWFGSIPGSSSLRPSSIEVRLKQSSIPWTPVWQCVKYSRCNLLGDSLERGSSRPPYIYRAAQNPYIAEVASDQQLRAFAAGMQTATDGQQQAVIRRTLLANGP